MPDLPARYASLPIDEFAFPGPLRDRLVAAILDGSKTTTSCLLVEFEADGDPMYEAGQRSVVIDSAGEPVAVIELTGVRVVPLADIDLAHAVGEGEGYTTVAQWRAGHEQFWHGDEYRRAIADPSFTVSDTTLVVAQQFVLVEDLRGSAPAVP